MADYSNFTDIEIKYSPEFKELYYLALFCLNYVGNGRGEVAIPDRPIDHTVLKHVRDRFLELAMFPFMQCIPHPLANQYSDHTVEVKPDFTELDLATIKSDLASWGSIKDSDGNAMKGDDFTTAFDTFKTTLEAGPTYTVDDSKATVS